MTKIAKLVQSPENKAVIVNLEDDELAILTGVMGGCCSIIVLWGGLNKNGYKKIRGHHAGGGPGNLNWELLLEGVPNDANTKIVMSCAPADYADPDSYIDKVKAALKERDFKCKRSFYAFSNSIIDRHGSALPFDEMAKGANYEIRNKNARFIL